MTLRTLYVRCYPWLLIPAFIGIVMGFWFGLAIIFSLFELIAE